MNVEHAKGLMKLCNEMLQTSIVAAKVPPNKLVTPKSPLVLEMVEILFAEKMKHDMPLEEG